MREILLLSFFAFPVAAWRRAPGTFATVVVVPMCVTPGRYLLVIYPRLDAFGADGVVGKGRGAGQVFDGVGPGMGAFGWREDWRGLVSDDLIADEVGKV